MREIMVEAPIVGDLYHGTSIVNAAAIVSQQMLIADDSHGDAAGVSFTRSQKLGWQFAGIAEERALQFDNDERPKGSSSLRGALLVFDGAAMRAALGPSLKPYAWSPADGIDDEEEERFHGDRVDAEHHLKMILALPADIAWWAQVIPQLSNTYDAAFAKTVAALTRHRLFKAA